jgi:hypothetical protein
MPTGPVSHADKTMGFSFSSGLNRLISLWKAPALLIWARVLISVVFSFNQMRWRLSVLDIWLVDDSFYDRQYTTWWTEKVFALFVRAEDFPETDKAHRTPPSLFDLSRYGFEL